MKFQRDDEGTLVVTYRTHFVKIHPPSKTVHVKAETLPEEQPMLTGFKLETYDFPLDADYPITPSQAVRMNSEWIRDYGAWRMDSKSRGIDGERKARYYWLGWGSKANPKVIAKIRRDLVVATHDLGPGLTE